MIGCSRASATDESQSKWNIKLGYSRFETPFTPRLFKNNGAANQFQTEISYNFSRYVECGIYGGYARFGARPYPLTNSISSDQLYYDHVPFYGVVANFHFLPFFVDTSRAKLDIYVAGKIGGHYFTTPDDFIPFTGHETDSVIGGGIAYYPWKHFGGYAEYYFGNNMTKRFGIAFKF